MNYPTLIVMQLEIDDSLHKHTKYFSKSKKMSYKSNFVLPWQSVLGVRCLTLHILRRTSTKLPASSTSGTIRRSTLFKQVNFSGFRGSAHVHFSGFRYCRSDLHRSICRKMITILRNPFLVSTYLKSKHSRLEENVECLLGTTELKVQQ